MQELPEALAPLAAYNQFCLYKLVWDAAKNGFKKIPISPHTMSAYIKGEDWQKNPNSTTDINTAIIAANAMGDAYGVGFLVTANDPFYFVDLDNCLLGDNKTWSPVAMDVLARLPGAAVEVSQSGRGLHIIGTGICPDHGCKNISLGLELYTQGRVISLTGTNTIGSVSTDSSAVLPSLIQTYFTPTATAKATDWTTVSVIGSAPIEDDAQLIAKAMGSQSAAGVFGSACTFTTLWECDETKLAESYPDPTRSDGGMYGKNEADAALAQHLAFWTGNNCERMLNLMWMSGLNRDKWEREDYIKNTIKRAVGLQEVFYTGGKQLNTEGVAISEQFGAPKLRANSDAQREYANGIRSQKLADCLGDEELILKLCSASGANTNAKFWIDNKEYTPFELGQMITPIDSASGPMGEIVGPQIVSGHQYLSATMQLEHFTGCYYVQSIHKIFVPSGDFLKSEQFNAIYGGYVFQLDDTGNKTTRKAYEAFTESQMIRYPKAHDSCFRPLKPPGQLVEENKRLLINSYMPIETPRLKGDPMPFLVHLQKLLPNPNDRAIFMAFMAACIQYKGYKFQWSPLIQGVEGNGKTLFTRCIVFAIGEKHTHLPRASEIGEKYNEWLFNKLFIGIEDIYVPEHKREIIEILKPMITNSRLPMRAMQACEVMGDNVANLIFNSNYKDAVRKTRNDRRFGIFYTAQQHADDLTRDGLTGPYFANLYKWLEAGGYAIVSDYLHDYAIPDELNPANGHRAPITSSTEEAVTASMGSIEQEILEAIDEGRPGFAGGWVSSMAIERLLQLQRMTRAIPINKRRELMQNLGYDWHPALNMGRVNNFIAIDAGKPRLFIKKDHIHSNLTTPSEVVKHYQDAQGPAIYNNMVNPADVFR